MKKFFFVIAMYFGLPICFAADGFQTGALTVRQVATVPTLLKSTDLTYNPTYSTGFSFAPSYRFSRSLSVDFTLGFAYEWTESDVQTTPHEIWFNDPSAAITYPLAQSADSRFTLSGSSSIALPFSPPSRAASLIARADQSLVLATKTQLWSVNYILRASKYAHRFTTGQLDAPRLGACSGVACLRLMHTGVRNPTASVANIVNNRFHLGPKMSLVLTAGLIQSLLYPLTTVSGLPSEEGPNRRYATLTSVVAQFELKNGCSVRSGVENYHGQLRPDGAIQRPLLNRNAQIFVDLVMTSRCFTIPKKGLP